MVNAVEWMAVSRPIKLFSIKAGNYSFVHLWFSALGYVKLNPERLTRTPINLIVLRILNTIKTLAVQAGLLL